MELRRTQAIETHEEVRRVQIDELIQVVAARCIGQNGLPCVGWIQIRRERDAMGVVATDGADAEYDGAIREQRAFGQTTEHTAQSQSAASAAFVLLARTRTNALKGAAPHRTFAARETRSIEAPGEVRPDHAQAHSRAWPVWAQTGNAPLAVSIAGPGHRASTTQRHG